MSPEAVHAFKPRIDDSERHHRRERDARVVKHWEFVDEVPVREVALDSPRVVFAGQDFLVDSQLVAEERELLFLGFEISEILISEDEIERDEPGSDVFGRMDTPETNILPANCLIQIACEEMKDSAMPKGFLRAGMLLFHHFSGKCNVAFAGL